MVIVPVEKDFVRGVVAAAMLGLATASVSAQASDFSRYQISRVLEAESRVSTVGEAMEIKRSGLGYVEDLSDFEYLSTFAVGRPSEAYQRAVGDFIAAHVAAFTHYRSDLYYIRLLEQRTPTVSTAMAVKEAAMRVCTSIEDFVYMLPYSVGSPSDAYKRAVSEFTARSIARVLAPYSRIDLIIQAEVYTVIVSDAMAVKNAGLVAVHSRRDLYELARYSVDRPSDAYIRAVDEWVRFNAPNYP